MYQDAIEQFIKDYKEDNDVEAILLVGSYAAGNNNEYSDIDIYIILNDKVNYRKRGNKKVGNYLIEYFCNSKKQIYGYLEEDLKKHHASMANMLENGIILYDKNNIIPELKNYIKNLPKNNEKNYMMYYACWNAYDEYLAAKYHNVMQYYICLKYLVNCYLINNGYNELPECKIERFFKDKIYRKNYKIDFPKDYKFINLVNKCFDECNKNNLKKLYNYVLRVDNFDINNFEIKEEL